MEFYTTDLESHAVTGIKMLEEHCRNTIHVHTLKSAEVLVHKFVKIIHLMTKQKLHAKAREACINIVSGLGSNWLFLDTVLNSERIQAYES